MGTRIQIDGVGTVEVDDNFSKLSPEDQQRTVEEIAASAKHSGAATAPAPTQAPAAKPAPSGEHTYQAIERFVKAKFPNVQFTSDYRDPQHNREVGGVEGSLHTTYQGVDMTGLDDSQRAQLKQELHAAGVDPDEFLFHNAGSGMHLHIGARHLPDEFLAQWGNHPAPVPADAAAPPPQDLSATNAELRRMFHSGASTEDLLAYGKAHNVLPNADQIDHARKNGMDVQFVQPNKTPAKPERTWGDTALDMVRSLGEGAVKTVGGTLAQAPSAIAMALGGPAMNNLVGQPLSDKIAESSVAPTKTLDQGYEAVVGKPKATTTGERYLNAGAEQVGSFLVPAGAASKVSLARRALATLAAGVGSGVGGEAAHDVAPSIGADPDTARTVGQILGAVVGGAPTAAKPIADARFVSRTAKDARAPLVAKAVERMDEVAKQHAPNGVMPKGRGPLTVQQINAIGNQYLHEIGPRLSAMPISQLEKTKLHAAIARKADITEPELQELEKTPEGQAVAEGIRFHQAVGDLTPPYNGYKPGPIRKAVEMLGNVAGSAALGPFGSVAGTVIRRVLRADPGDVNMSRLDAGRKALQRKELFAKVGKLTGSDQVGQKTAAFIQKHEDTLAANDAELAAAAKAKQDAQAARADQQAQAAAAKQAKEDAKAARHGMSDKEYASHMARTASANEALNAAPVPASRSAKAQAALDKYNKAATTGTSKLADFDEKLNAPPEAPKPVKRKAEDLAVENNMDQGIKGKHRAYAETLSSYLGVTVEPKDVLAKLKSIKTDDVDPFELRKFQMEHKVSPAARQALVPRLEKALREDPKVMGRTQAPAKAAEPRTSNVEQQSTAAPAPPQDDEIRRVVRQGDYDRGASSYIGRAESKIASIKADPEIPGGRRDEVVNAAEIVKRDHKTKESARRWIDFEYLPKLEAEGVDPKVIDHIQKQLHEVADVGKKHGTQAELDAATRRHPRGRPVKAPTDDVPF